MNEPSLDTKIRNLREYIATIKTDLMRHENSLGDLLEEKRAKDQVKNKMRAMTVAEQEANATAWAVKNLKPGMFLKVRGVRDTESIREVISLDPHSGRFTAWKWHPTWSPGKRNSNFMLRDQTLVTTHAYGKIMYVLDVIFGSYTGDNKYLKERLEGQDIVIGYSVALDPRK